MSRRSNVKKGPVPPDPVYNSRLVSMMIRRLMMDGKKSVASRILYDAFKLVEEKTNSDPLETFEQAVRNVTPLVQVKARRVGGATYQVPMEVRPERGTSLALRWLSQYSRSRSGKPWRFGLPTKLLMRQMKQVAPFGNGKKPTKWQKPTKLLLTTATKGKTAVEVLDGRWKCKKSYKIVNSQKMYIKSSTAQTRRSLWHVLFP